MKPELRLLSPYIRESKAFLDCGFRIPGTGSGFFFVSGTWIPSFNRLRDSGFLELNCRLQSPGFRIPKQKLVGFRFQQVKI